MELTNTVKFQSTEKARLESPHTVQAQSVRSEDYAGEAEIFFWNRRLIIFSESCDHHADFVQMTCEFDTDSLGDFFIPRNPDNLSCEIDWLEKFEIQFQLLSARTDDL